MKIFNPYNNGTETAITATAQSVWNGTANTSWYTSNPSASTYTITTAEQLAGLAQLVNSGSNMSGKTINLGANIYLNNIPWTAIGNSYSNSFSGTFDGNGYTISGVYINTDNDYQGLFGILGSIGNSGTIKNVGIVDSYINGGSSVGDLVGQNNGAVRGSYYDKQSSGQSTSAGGTGKTTAEMQSEEFATLLNLGAGVLSMNAWVYTSGEYPKLSNIQASAVNIASYFAEGTGTEAKPYIINTKEHLEYLSLFVNLGKNFSGQYFKLGNNISLNDTTNWQNWATTAPANSWVAIGTFYANPFIGTFDGAGYVISGVYINNNNNEQGLFGYLGEGGTIKNVGVVASYIKGGRFIGSLVGDNEGTVSNSYSIGTVNGTTGYVGGLVGGNGGTVSNSYSTGAVSGSSYVGGLVGENGGTVSNSYSNGAVSGSSYVGGLVGQNYNSTSTVSYSYSTGAVTGTGDYVGGLVGSNEGTISNSYYDKQTSGRTDTGRGSGKTTLEMKTQTTYVSWNFADIWGISEGINAGYPYLIAPVQNIIEVPTSAIYTQTITLNTTVLPQTARNNIVWSLISGDVTITGNRITFNAVGEVKIKATIAKGTSTEKDYVQEFTITGTPKPVTILGLSVADKEYDGNTTATITGSAVINGVVPGDELTIIHGTASFVDKEPGIGKTVMFGGYSLSGANAGNYILSGQPANVTANIFAATPILPQIASGGKIQVQTIGNNIVLQNLPTNSKVEVYNLKGNRIYLGNAENISTLSIGVQTKGMYIVKASFGSEKQVMRVAVR